MYPAPFRYHRPASLSEAVEMLSGLGDTAKPLAGGQTLIPILKLRMDEPSDLVDIARLPALHYMDNNDGVIRIGALATHGRIGKSDISKVVPILGDCANGIADAQVRSMGTIGGSVSAADPSCDWPALLHVLNAEIICQGEKGRRTVPIREFIQDSYTTALIGAELVTEIRFKAPASNSGGAYIGFKKAAPAYPAASAGVQLSLTGDNVCEEVSLVLGAAGPRPVISAEAENFLRGRTLTADLLKQAAEILLDASDPPADSRGSSDFKRAMLKSIFLKAAFRAIERAGGELIEGGPEYV
ncbi:MAG: xanthine dehydrogenase family protein subunit M [Candidatus Thiodiazotropha sp. (ex Ustalcina ferruginea)]|nr:xanthine dehydrogenase family protein subunit M [Candidatus Thiodiazotropha sp. (ex Ustalcina ferruginea)]